MEFQALPEGCIADILSRTTPLDVCRLSLVSKIFRSAAESDAVWDRFLPSDYHFIISQSSPPLPNYPSKKALFLALSDRPIIIDQGKMSFQLERKSGKKCYMLATRALTIIWGDTPAYWNWTTLPDCRDAKFRETIFLFQLLLLPQPLVDPFPPKLVFPEVAELVEVCWLEIRGVLNTLALSPNTQYAAYLVFKMINARGFRNLPVELVVGITGGDSSTKNACLGYPYTKGRPNNRVAGLPRPNERSDGWLEIEMGEFFNTGLEYEVQMSVMEIRDGDSKSGLFVEGIEVRPKEHN